MLRLAADENFNNNIVRGLLRRRPGANFVRVQDVGLSRADDPTVLKWAAEQGRVVASHDVSTLRKYAYDRVAAGLRMPGVFEVPNSLSIGSAIDDLLLLIDCSLDGDGRGRFGTCRFKGRTNRKVRCDRRKFSRERAKRTGDPSSSTCRRCTIARRRWTKTPASIGRTVIEPRLPPPMAQ